MMREIGVGLIGYGLAGRVFHAPFVALTPELALRAVVSRDVAKVHAGLPGMAVVPDVATLLARPDVDLVIVASPDEFHAEHAIAALQAGKHVVVDKPFATSAADARAMAEAANAGGKMLTAFQNRRWDADFLTLRRLIGEGRLGEIVHFESHFDRWRPVPADVWKEARAGGSWLDLGPHLVDQALCLFGRPDAVTADLAALRPGAPAPDWFHVVLHYPGRRAVLRSSKMAADHSLRFAVHGTGGSWIKPGIDPQEPAILAGGAPGGPDWGLDPVIGHFTDGADPSQSAPVPNERGDYRLFWQALADALNGKGDNPVPAEQAIAVMEVLEAGMASAEQGRRISLS
ncbi:oxidoreductase [Novosphingobium sediminicola]|nr:oxidoreductase [Novosphingobium sediminicola]